LAPSHVLWITDGTQYCYWDEFAYFAKNMPVTRPGRMNLQLRIVGKNWWMTPDPRRLDWIFHAPESKPTKQGPVNIFRPSDDFDDF
jgi:hypothetical protein